MVLVEQAPYIIMFTIKETNKVKGIAVLLLLFHHLFSAESNYIYSVMTVEQGVMNKLIAVGVMARICVWLFAFLSAYGLSCKYMEWKKSDTKFCLKYLISIIQSLLIVYIIVFIINVLQGRAPWEYYNHNIRWAFLDMFGWADFFGTPTFCGAWWYMCFTQVMIIMLPFCVKLLKQFGFIVIPFTYIFLYFLQGCGLGSNFSGNYCDYLICTLLGCWCAMYGFFDKLEAKRWRGFKGVIVAVAALAVIAWFTLWRYRLLINGDVRGLQGTLAALTAFLISVFSYMRIRSKIFEVPLEFLGKHSSGMYLFHVIIYAQFPQIVFWSKNPVISYIVLLVISLVVSILISMVRKYSKYDQLFKNLVNKLLQY